MGTIASSDYSTFAAGGATSLVWNTSKVATPPTPSLTSYVVRPCGCRCPFCPDCARKLGRATGEALKEVLLTFKAITMVSFTVDPQLFPSPAEAYAYVRDHDCVRKTILAIHRNRLTHSPRYFCAVEWQEHTEQVHFHVLLDASSITEEQVFKMWSRRRPPQAGPVQFGRPPLGWVHVSPPSRDHGEKAQAAGRAASYVTKVPHWGFPTWVMGMGTDKRIRRFSTNQGFWSRPNKPKAPPRPPSTAPRAKRQKFTYAEKISKCKTTANVFEVGEWIDRLTGEVKSERWLFETQPAEDIQPGEPAYVNSKIQACSAEGVLDQIDAQSGRLNAIVRMRQARPRHPTPAAAEGSVDKGSKWDGPRFAE